jgi:hypothetical protein
MQVCGYIRARRQNRRNEQASQKNNAHSRLRKIFGWPGSMS